MNKNFLTFVSILVSADIIKSDIFCDSEGLKGLELVCTLPQAIADIVIEDSISKCVRLSYELYTRQGADALMLALAKYRLEMIGASAADSAN